MADITQAETFAGQVVKTTMKDMGDGTYAPVVYSQPVSGGSASPFVGLTPGFKAVTTAGTPVKLTAAVTACKQVDIVAYPSNTGLIYVGNASVLASTKTGVPLAPGDPYTVSIDDLSKIYIDSAVNGEGVSYVYYN